MSDRAPYSRIYWSVRSDERLVTIYPDDRHLATWVRLLIAADMAWPAPADLPASVRRPSLAALEAAGVIEVLPGGLFRFHGLDTERGRRADAARASAAHRTGSERGANGERTVPFRSARRAEQSKDETSTTREDDGRADLEAFLLVRRRAPTRDQRALLDRMVAFHGEAGPQWMADVMMRHPDDPIGAVIAADKELREERITAALEADKPKHIPHRPRTQMTAVSLELSKIFRQQEAEEALNGIDPTAEVAT